MRIQTDRWLFFVVSLLDFTKATLIRFWQDRCTEIASALTYVALLSLVPLATVSFSILQSMVLVRDGFAQLEHLLLSVFAPDIGEKLAGYVHAFVDRAQELSGWSVVVLLVTVIWAFSTVERAFNHIWRVPQPRRTWVRWLTYFLLIALGPLSLTLALAITLWLAMLPLWAESMSSLVKNRIFFTLLSTSVVFAVFTCMYRWIPNQKVLWRHAMGGALVAAILFEIIKRGFALYLLWFPTHEAIYGALALLPLTMIWIHAVWLNILFGAEISFGLGLCGQEPRPSPGDG